MSRIAGLTKKTPPLSKKRPRFFLNSSKLIPTSCAPLLNVGQATCPAAGGAVQLNVDRPAEIKNGGLVDHTLITPMVQPPTILSTKPLELFKKDRPLPKGSS